MHFMNPVPVMKLVEIIPGLITDEATKTTTLDLASQMGKKTTQSADFAGFIANRLLCPYLNEAFNALAEVLFILFSYLVVIVSIAGIRNS